MHHRGSRSVSDPSAVRKMTSERLGVGLPVGNFGWMDMVVFCGSIEEVARWTAQNWRVVGSNPCND